MNAELQRIARRDKKPFWVINAKKEENNRMGKTRDILKKKKSKKANSLSEEALQIAEKKKRS